MFDCDEHLDNLIRHIGLVRDACVLLGRRLIKQNEQELGILLIAQGFQHDVSKFRGIEWEYMHRGPDTPKDELSLAVLQHTKTNQHHPEYWGGVDKMPSLYIAEMVCDWYARAQEFGTNLREWIEDTAIEKYDIGEDSVKRINRFVDLLLKDSFVKEEE